MQAEHWIIVLPMLGVLIPILWAWRDNYNDKKAHKAEQARAAERRKTFQRRVFPAITTAPLPACGNAPKAPVQLSADQSLLSHLEAFMTCEVLVDGESFVNPLDSDHRNGPAIRYRTLADLEALAKKHAHQEWLVKMVEPLQSFVYQRHGPGQWNLVRVGTGMF